MPFLTRRGLFHLFYRLRLVAEEHQICWASSILSDNMEDEDGIYGMVQFNFTIFVCIVFCRFSYTPATIPRDTLSFHRPLCSKPGTLNL